MIEVRLAAEERLVAAYARYDEVWDRGEHDALPSARLELCLALLACGEELPPPVIAQMDRDRTAIAPPLLVRLDAPAGVGFAAL
jgi:hypothetical protein